ncbi:hypothetical protein [Streptomyces sp. NPDC127072]|uniref:hypothetical protein n=1 Tax=Streptomyces sp. NPDC127072 TaxID=3347129 RepID=UPI00364FF699
MAESYPTLLAGQRATAGLLRSMLPQWARKTADTARAATTTTVADPHLTFEVEAGAVYGWDGWLKYDGATGGDLGVAFGVPSGSLGEWRGIGPGVLRVISFTDAASPVVTVDTAASTGYLMRVETNDVNALRTFGALGVGTGLTVSMDGTLRVGPTAGTFSLNWAQRTSDATATTVYTDSWIKLQRIA